MIIPASTGGKGNRPEGSSFFQESFQITLSVEAGDADQVDKGKGFPINWHFVTSPGSVAISQQSVLTESEPIMVTYSQSENKNSSTSF